MYFKKLILGIDLEGVNANLVDRGLCLETDRVIEIGAVLWDVDRKGPVQLYSHLIDEKDRSVIDDDLRELTGIDDTMLADWGLKGSGIGEKLRELAALMEKANYLMAHNAHGYDLPMLKALYERHSLEMPSKIWIDSSQDIEFPRSIKHKSLSHLEYAHGFINPFPHRALTDVLSMLKIASQYPLDRMVELAKSPRVTIIAKFRPPNWQDREEVQRFNVIKNKVSRAKFRWNPEKRVWSKDIHKLMIDENKIHYDFNWEIHEEHHP